MIQATSKTARVERVDEVSVTYLEADFKATPDGLVVSREDGDELLAWYAPGTWTAVIFGVPAS